MAVAQTGRARSDVHREMSVCEAENTESNNSAHAKGALSIRFDRPVLLLDLKVSAVPQQWNEQSQTQIAQLLSCIRAGSESNSLLTFLLACSVQPVSSGSR